MRFMPRWMLWKKCIAMVTVFCLIGGACLINPQRSWALSLSDEKELGRKLLRSIRQHMPVVEDGEIAAYIQSLGSRLTEQIGTTPYQYKFFVIDQGIPNAFAIPGGYIFIYRGLIELMETEGELAGILSHEVSHIQARHIHRRLESGKISSIATLAGVLAAAVLGLSGGGAAATQALTMGSIAGAQTYALKYSRENEEEADQMGLRTLCAAGYAPSDMVNCMGRLGQGQFRAGSNIPSYLSTHPALGDRIQYLQDLITCNAKELGAKKPSRPPCSDDFYMMQAALVAEYTDTPLAVERLQMISRKSKAAAEYGEARLQLRQGKVAEALPILQDTARKAAGSPLVLSSLGALYLQQGKISEAQRVLQTALILDSSSPVVHLRLAQVLQELGQRDEALQHLQQVEDFSANFPEIDHQLGILFGQMNRMGPAHYHLGQYYEARQDWKNAFFHYEKAKGLLKDSPDKLAEVEDALKDIEKRKKEAMWEKQRR